MISPQFATTIMQYFIGGLLALIPLLVWGIIFYRKKKTKSKKKHIVISFVAGIFSVIPIFMVLGDMGSTVISLGVFHIDGLHIYNSLEQLASNPGPLSLLSYIVVSILVFFAIYVISGLITFVLEMTAGGSTIETFQKTLRRSFEEPFLAISLGILIGLFAYFFHWSLHVVFWKSMMIGVVEEYTKHLLVRFVDEDNFKSIADAILFSILVALGFAFLENILYFVDKIWLSPCTTLEIQQGMCLFNERTGYYVHEVGVLLAPFIFRSIFSTLAHVLFSGIFGYYYGVAHFATEDVIEKYKRRTFHPLIQFLSRLLFWKKEVVFHRQKILEGAVIAMGFHGLFNFFLDEQVYALYLSKFHIGPVFILIPGLVWGYVFLSKQFRDPNNEVELVGGRQ